jgi:hypothetical protein
MDDERRPTAELQVEVDAVILALWWRQLGSRQLLACRNGHEHRRRPTRIDGTQVTRCGWWQVADQRLGVGILTMAPACSEGRRLRRIGRATGGRRSASTTRTGLAKQRRTPAAMDDGVAVLSQGNGRRQPARVLPAALLQHIAQRVWRPAGGAVARLHDAWWCCFSSGGIRARQTDRVERGN